MPEVAPDPAAVRRALAAAFPDLAVERCAFLAEGWDSQAWEVNDALIFRFPKRAEVADWLRREIALLPALAPALPVPIPRFTHIADTGSPLDPALPFVGYPALRGTFLDGALELLAPASPLVPQLAAFLGALHRFPVAHAAACGVTPGTWERWVAWWRDWLGRVAGAHQHLDPELYAWMEGVLRDFLAELTAAERPVALIHHDLALEHILIDSTGRRITGVIDWGDAAIGDPALDFAGLVAPAPLDALLAAYPRAVDDRFRRRAAWYARLGPFHLLYFGLHMADPETIARGVAAIREARDSCQGDGAWGVA